MSTIAQECEQAYVNTVAQALDGQHVSWLDVMDALIKVLEAKHEERLLRLFACDCADHVLYIYEKVYPNDLRPRQAIDTARRYAEGNATTEEIETAWAAAGDAAWAVARDAAGDAAEAAAGDAAEAAAEAASWAAAGAAGDAAWAAAWAAGDAAGYAARAAAWAAGDAAWAAAEDAAAASTETQWQVQQLLALCGVSCD